MKISVEVDLTPQEARAFLGLPDLEPVHTAYIERLREMIGSGLSPDLVEQMVKSWSPMGEAGMKLWSGLLEGVTRSSTQR